MESVKINKSFWLFAVLFIAAGFIIYSPSIDATRYGDDYTIVPENSSAVFAKIWTTTYQRLYFYRPIEDTITTLFIFTFGYNTLPTHILFITLHCVFSIFVYYVLLKLRFSPGAAVTGGLLMLCSQLCTTTVGSNDTLGQIITSFLTFLNLWLIYSALSRDENKVTTGTKLLSALIFTLCLFTKESSAAFIPLLTVLLLIKIPLLKTRSLKDLKRILFLLLPYVVIFVIFFTIRSQIVTYKPGIGSGTYDFNIGINIPKNILMLLFALILPFSSARLYEAASARNFAVLLPVAGLIFIFVSMLFYGIIRSKKIKESLVIACFIFAGFFPPVILNHVNEQYTYYSLPFFIIIAAMAFDYYIKSGSGLLKKIFYVFAAILILTNAVSVMDKTAMIDKMGDRSKELTGQIQKFIPEIPKNGSLVLVNPKTNELRYSCYMLPGFETIRYTDWNLYYISGRTDFVLYVIEENEIPNYNKAGALILKLSYNKVIKYN